MKRVVTITAILVSTLLIVGCNKQTSPQSEKKPPRGPKTHLVEVITVEPKASSSAHERNGTLKARRIIRIHNQEEGRIQQLPFFEGDTIQPGDVLVQLDDRLLSAEITKAKATLRQAQLDKNRIAGLVKKRAASKDELTRANTALQVAIAELKLLETRFEFTTIRAPIAGIVTERLMEPGDLAAKNSHLMTITDPNSLVIKIHLSELLLPYLQAGDSVSIRVDALKRQRYAGSILRIHPELDPVTRQGVVEVTFDDIPAGARAGQFARVELETAKVSRLLVPFNAVRRDRDGEFVYMLTDKQQANRTPISTGIRIASEVEVIAGLNPGDQVITRGFLGISDGKKVKPVNSTFNQQAQRNK